MQITTFNTRSASHTCHLFKFISANTSTQKNKFDFSKTMFANEIVSFTISSISKSPTCGFVFVITCQRHPARKKIKPFQIYQCCFHPNLTNTLLTNNAFAKNTKHIFCSFRFYKQQPKKYACCKTWLHLFVFCKFSTCYKWTKWAKWAAILSELSPLSPLKTN